MGDKSPKAINRQKKQDAAHKDMKKAEALAKANPEPVVPGNKARKK